MVLEAVQRMRGWRARREPEDILEGQGRKAAVESLVNFVLGHRMDLVAVWMWVWCMRGMHKGSFSVFWLG